MAAPDANLKTVLGDKTAKALERELDVGTVDELLRHYPRRYAKRGELTDLAALREDEHVTVLARVKSSSSRPVQQRNFGSRKGARILVEVVVTDGNDDLRLTFFNQAWRAKQLHVGVVGLFSGKVSTFRSTRQLAHPDCQVLDGPAASIDDVEELARALIPVYPATAKLPSWRIQAAVRIVLDHLDVDADPMPESVRRRHHLVGLRDALVGVHRPGEWDELGRARRRLK